MQNIVELCTTIKANSINAIHKILFILDPEKFSVTLYCSQPFFKSEQYPYSSSEFHLQAGYTLRLKMNMSYIEIL